MQQTLSHKQSGSALVVIVAFLALIAVSVLLGSGDFATANNADRERETLREMSIVTASIAAYVQRNDVVPCPANPATAETNTIPVTGFGYEARTVAGLGPCVSSNGILPFRTLQIPEKFARDEWGNYYTYAVTPSFSVFNTDSYRACRVASWYQTLSGTDYHLNPTKASFCCPPSTGTGTDMRINTIAGILLEPPAPRSYPPLTSAPTADGVGVIMPPFTPAVGERARAAAYILLSHGRNGHGAYVVNGTAARLPSPSVPERENANLDPLFFDNNQILSGVPANYFDDLLVYKNQYQIYSQLGGGTCSRPWR